jgi:uncharacterized membrane protein YphA (DoxX/SURF4 family)
MKTGLPSYAHGCLDTAAVLARWSLGALFLYVGLLKALHPVEFLKLVRQYEMVGSPLLLNLIAAALPWFEAFCGLLLLFGVAVRGSALTLLIMLIPFTFVVAKRAWAIHAAEGIPFCAVSFDCGCGTGEVLICRKLVENSALVFLSAWLTTGGSDKLCARHRLINPSRLYKPSADSHSQPCA